MLESLAHMRISRRAFIAQASALAVVALAGCGTAAAPAPSSAAPIASPSAGAGSSKPAGSPSSGPSSSAAANSSAGSKPAASAAASAKPAASGKPALTPVRAAWVATTANMMLFPIAKEAGYFEKYGLDVDLRFIQGSGTALAAMVSGDLNMMTAGGSTAVTAAAAGSDAVIVAGLINKAIFRVMAMPDTTSLAQLKGKTIAVTRVGNGDYFAWKKIQKDQGWADSDLNFVGANSVEGQVGALTSGQAQAIAVTPPNDVTAERAGAHLIFDTSTIDEPDQGLTLTTTRKYLSANRPTMLAALKATIESMARWKKDPEFVKGIIAKYLKLDDQRVIDVGYEAYLPIWPQAPYPSREGLQVVIEQASAQDAKAKGVTPDQVTDTSLVKELDDSGFIKQTYGG